MISLAGLLTSAGLAAWGRAQIAALSLLGLADEPNRNVWGVITPEGDELLPLSSVLSCEVRGESNVVSAPVEQGSFASYNKVSSPMEVNLSVALAGSESDIMQILTTLAAIKRQPVVMTIITPNGKHTGMTLYSISWQRRREDGIGLMFVDLGFQEIREVETKTADAKLAPRKNRGLQQPGASGKDKQKSVSVLTSISKLASKAVF